MKTKPMKAWLIMWEWAGTAPAHENRYVDIVSSRKNISYVKDYTQRLHDLRCLSLEERIPAARYNKPATPPYEATVHKTSFGAEIHCGHNPYLVARRVRDMTIELDSSTGAEVVRWKPHKPKNSS